MFEKLTGGVAAEVYRLELSTSDGSIRQVVLRVHGADYPGHSAKLEFELLNALHLSGLPVPKPIAVDANLRIIQHPYVLMDFIEGSSQIPKNKAETFIGKIASVMAEIHTTDISSLPELPRRIDPLPELFDFLSHDDAAQDLQSKLGQLKSTAFKGSNALLHGDLWPENLIWRASEIAAILDWEDAAIGDPMSDVACTALELRYLYGVWGMNQFKQAYSTLANIDPYRFTLWQAYVAAGALRYMGEWGLEPKREAHMRKTALTSLAEADQLLCN